MRAIVAAIRGLSIPVIALAASAVVSCKEPPPTPFRMTIHVEADPGQPLANVPILFRDANNPNAAEIEVKRTDAQGNATLETARPDGETLRFAMKCPADTDPAEPINVTVRRTEGAAPKFDRSCRPQIRTIAVVVRAENGPNLPVMFLGREITRTDASGAAHFSTKLRSGDTFTVGISTKEDDKLKPRDPSAMMTVGQRDDVQLVNVKFEREKPKPAPYRGPKKPKGPVQIN
jgi:hypothetical protein